MISTIWSGPEAPGKMGWPRYNSAKMQPALQRSVWVVGGVVGRGGVGWGGW